MRRADAFGTDCNLKIKEELDSEKIALPDIEETNEGLDHSAKEASVVNDHRRT